MKTITVTFFCLFFILVDSDFCDSSQLARCDEFRNELETARIMGENTMVQIINMQATRCDMMIFPMGCMMFDDQWNQVLDLETQMLAEGILVDRQKFDSYKNILLRSFHHGSILNES